MSLKTAEAYFDRIVRYHALDPLGARVAEGDFCSDEDALEWLAELPSLGYVGATRLESQRASGTWRTVSPR
jgi:hypothetical protein